MQRQKTEVMDDEVESIQSYFLRCIEEANKSPFLGIKLPDGRLAVVDCQIRILQNG